MAKYKAGLYLRLSRDDRLDNESLSISNQKALLEEYANERGWEIEDTYIDDGVSGTTFDRPGFNRMIQDIDDKRINMVMVKDQSRLGRNYSQVGHYTDYFFPKNNVRFIAVNDRIDSENDNDFAGFINVINEHYAKDISRKIKSTKKNQMKKGQFIGSQPAMGYMRDPTDKHHLVIEDIGAEIIRRLFYMYSMGNSARHIAQVFNNEKIPTPRVHFFSRLNKPNPYKNDAESWGSATVLRILKNQVYIGHMCQGKRRKKNIKMKHRDVVPEDEWTVVENTHEPLIDEITWNRVQAIMKDNKRKTHARPKKDGTFSLFARKVFCADCGAKMIFHRSKNGKYKEYPRYRCSTYTNQGKDACSFNMIREDELAALVLSEIKKFSYIANNYADNILDKLMQVNRQLKAGNNNLLEKQLNKVEKDLQGISNKIDVLLDQMVNSNISEQMFKQLMSKYEQKQAELKSRRISLKSDMNEAHEDTKHIADIIEKFKARNYVEELDRETVVELIDHIVIFKKEKVGKEYFQQVDIYFNFIGKISHLDYDDLKEFMKDKLSNPVTQEQVG